MDASYLLLGIGIISMTFAYGLFTGAQYFSVVYMLLLLALPFLSIALLMLAYMVHGRARKQVQKGDAMVGLAILLSGISILIIAIEANFVSYSNPEMLSNSLTISLFIFALAFFTTALAYVFNLVLSKKKTVLFELFLVACIATGSLALAKVEMITAFGSAVPVGTDELAFDYNAAGMFLAGNNPYVANFANAFSKSNIVPTLYLNGTNLYNYPYPPVAFLSLLPFAALMGSYSNFLPVALALGIAIVMAVLVLLFRISNGAGLMFVPAFAISLALFSITPWALPKLILMGLLVLAYLLRQRACAYPLLLGVALSLHELAWVAFPFFLLLTLRESGWKRTFQVFAAAAAAFIVINAYFFYSSPAAFLNDLLGSAGTWLLPRQLNLMQFLIVFYPVGYNYMLPFFILLYVTMLLLFYFYKGARPLMCLTTSAIFLFTNSSSLSYVLPFMPILVCLLIEKKPEEGEGGMGIRKMAYFACALAALSALFLLMTFYSHVAYAQLNTINISHILPVIGNSSQVKTLSDIIVQFKMGSKNDTDLNLYVVSIRPAMMCCDAALSWLPASTPTNYTNYTLPAGLYNITNSTRIKVFASSDHYITSK